MICFTYSFSGECSPTRVFGVCAQAYRDTHTQHQPSWLFSSSSSALQSRPHTGKFNIQNGKHGAPNFCFLTSRYIQLNTFDFANLFLFDVFRRGDETLFYFVSTCFRLTFVFSYFFALSFFCQLPDWWPIEIHCCPGTRMNIHSLANHGHRMSRLVSIECDEECRHARTHTHTH